MPSRAVLSRLLRFAHGIRADRARGPVPSAGGLQALELYLVTFEETWLPPGVYHFAAREITFRRSIRLPAAKNGCRVYPHWNQSKAARFCSYLSETATV